MFNIKSNGDITLIQGDCLDVMPLLGPWFGKFDMVLTDPPYGTTACKWDSIIPLDKMWESISLLTSNNTPVVITSSQPFTSSLIMSNVKMFKHEWIWEKNRGSNFASVKYQPMKEHENVVVFCNGTPLYIPIKEPRKGKGADRVKYKFNGSNTGKREAYKKFVDDRVGHTETELRFPSSIQKFNVNIGLHPTQKPLALMEYLIRTYTNEGDLVLDFTMGSGTTGVACQNIGRKFVGIEKELEYFQIACERMGVSHV